MTTKTTGAEIKRFYADPAFWPEDGGDTYHDDEEVRVDGVPLDPDKGIAEIPDTAVVTIAGGIVFSPKWDGNEPSFETYFKRWRKAQSTVSIIVECDVSKRDAVVAAIRAAGGKVS
jgi:hypothetical protein